MSKRMYADFGDEAWKRIESGESELNNNGFRNKDGYYDPDQPFFSEIDDDGLDPESVLVGAGVAAGAMLLGFLAKSLNEKRQRKKAQKEAVIRAKQEPNAYGRDEYREFAAEIHEDIKKREELARLSVPNFSTEVDNVLNEYEMDADNEEAQKKLIEIMELSALLAQKIREYSGSVDFKTKDSIAEARRGLERLMTDRTAECINAILEKEPQFLEGRQFNQLYDRGKSELFTKKTISDILQTPDPVKLSYQKRPSYWSDIL